MDELVTFLITVTKHLTRSNLQEDESSSSRTEGTGYSGREGTAARAAVQQESKRLPCIFRSEGRNRAGSRAGL